MTTVLLAADDCDSTFISAHRCRFGARLLARARAFGLDAKLARGASPDSSPALSLRAQALIARRSRRSLARQLRSIIRAAELPAKRFDALPPRCRREIALERELIEQLAGVLERSEAVDARGVARVEMLLRDGASPVYYPPVSSDLGRSLQRAIDALEVGGEAWTTA